MQFGLSRLLIWMRGKSMTTAVQENASLQSQSSLPRFSYGRDASGLNPNLGNTRFLMRTRTYSPAVDATVPPTAASMITPCVVPVFRPDQKQGLRLKILLQARDEFRTACKEVGAPGWAMPDLFRAFLVPEGAASDLSGGVWWGDTLTARPGLRAKVQALETALREAEPGAEVRGALAAFDPAYLDMEQSEVRAFDATHQAEEAAQDAEARRFLSQVHIQVLHPTPLSPSSSDINGMSLIVEALRRVTAACDLELYVMGFGEIALGMIRLAKGKSHAAPVIWPLEGTQVSCLVPLDHDNLAYLVAHPWAAQEQSALYGLPEGAFRVASAVEDGSLRALEGFRSRLGVALGTQAPTLQGGGVWAQPRNRQWAEVGAGDLLRALILEDKQAGRAPEAVKAWEDYWAIRTSFADLMRQVAKMERVPKPGGSRGDSMPNEAWKVQVGRGNAALDFEVKLLENNGAGGFEDAVEHGIQARLLAAYAPRVIERLAERADLRRALQVDPLKMAIARLLLAGVQPVVPLGAFFPPLGAHLEKALLPVRPDFAQASLFRLDEPKAGEPVRRYSPDKLWVYLPWGGEDGGHGSPATGHFQAVSAKGPSLVEGVGQEAIPMGDRILAQMEANPTAAVPPAGKWLMLSREPFFA